MRFAFRQLLKNPGFTTLAVLTVALGIAGNVVMFSILNGIFLRPLPFQNAERLVDLDEIAPKWDLERTALAYFDLVDWRAENQTFQGMGAWEQTSFNLSLKDRPERVEARRVTHDLFGVLGIQPLLGRGILPEEDQPGKGQVALISHGLWQRMWGGQPDVLGQTLSLDAVPHTVVGVLPPNLGPLQEADVWVPLARSANDTRGWTLTGVGRLKPGVPLEAAQQDLTRIHKAQIPNRPANEITSPRLTFVRERYFGDYRLVMAVLVAAVGVVWFIACANVAGLMLARGLGRAREISVRMALGASRSRVICQILMESLLLSAVGGAIGIAAGQSSLRALLRLAPDGFPAWIDFGMDWRFAFFCTITTAVTACVFGLIPAFQMVSEVNLQGALQAASGKASGSSVQKRSLNALVIGEIALALVLLINAGLLLQAFRSLQRANPGFRSENVLTYDLSLPRAKYNGAQQLAFFEEHLAQIRTLPGVRAASATTMVPLGGHSGTFFEIEHAAPRARDEANPVVLQRKAFPGYAEAIGLTLLAGHFFSEEEARNTNTPPVVINESFARNAWGKQDPIGKRIRYPGPEAPWMAVVGLVKDVKHYGLDQPMRPGVYLPYHYAASRRMTVVVRALNNPQWLVPTLRTLIQKTDPDLPMFQVRTMTERVQASMWLRRAYSWLFGFFAAVALTMAVGGIYGVISYAVSRRTNEIGIRMALGAQRRDVLSMVLRQGIKLAGAGIVIGLAGATGLAQLTQRLLVGISPTDPITFLVLPLFLAGVTLLACLLPARRATRVDPMIALRYEG